MTHNELIQQKHRVIKYEELKKRHSELYNVILKINKDDPTGPNERGPFTGDTRESREIDALHINFSKTKGGAPAVEFDISELKISAYTFALFLDVELKKQISTLEKQMDII